MKRIAIIPARGGSKRIERKNIKPFLGQPIIAYSILSAINSNLFNEVMVSTDDEEIADVAKKYGATIPFFRSMKNADDFATTADVLLEVLQEYINRGTNFEFACCIYPTAPFVTKEKLKDAYYMMINNNSNAIVPVVKFSYPIQRAFKISNNILEYIWPENINKRSQDLEETYHDAGQFYWFNVNEMFKQKKLSLDNSMSFEISPLEVQDIDNYSDWELAELKYNFLKNKNIQK
ncbi:MAG: pseudaminic acid cytidylyltransferase [Melioribacteraceae bacterium]|jgi:pseudaminic acid cytidylyltransferase|nr:pseudaminic acid cytidylyltransferase [Melioribacteraceae bacterium]